MKANITFTLPAEAFGEATEAVLLGDFNNWSPDEKFKLKKQKDGSYKLNLSLEAGRTYQYRFLLNDGRWVNDYNAQHYVPVHDLFIDNCVITVPEAQEEPSTPQPATEKKTTSKSKKTEDAVKKAKPAKEKVATKSDGAESKSKKATAPKVKKEEKPAKAATKKAAGK